MAVFTVIFISLVGLIGAGVSNANNITEYIEVPSFAIGQCVKVNYTAPSTGRTTVQLSAADDAVVLSVDYRKHWNGNLNTGQPWQNIVVLNSLIGGEFGKEQHVEGIETTSGSLMAWRICAKDKEFSIILNHKEIATYAYRANVTTVSKVEFINQGYDSLLLKLSVVDSPSVQPLRRRQERSSRAPAGQ